MTDIDMKTMREMSDMIAERLLLVHKELLTTREACMYMGMTERALEDLRTQKALTYYKPNGKSIYYKRIDLDAWMMRNEVLSMDNLTLMAQEWCHRNKIKL